MPLARILTRNPERTTDLSSQLKQQGYSVEVARPDQTNLAPADLEIEFEVCERADVLDRAADLATELGADVAVAPGILKMTPKPAAEPIMYGSTAPQPVEPETRAPEPVLSQKIMAEPAAEKVIHLESQTAAERDPEREFESAFAPVIEMPAAQASNEVIDVPIMEQEPMPPVAFLEDSPAVEPMAAAPMAERHTEEHAAAPIIFPEPPRAADPMPYLAQLTPFSGRTNRADEKPQEAAPVVRRQDHSQIPERGKKVLQDGARVAAQTWAGALALAASTKASVRDHFEEYRKRAQVRSAEARAEHAARLLDLEQRRAEAHQRAAELELAREQAAARLMELVRQREPGLPPERVREQMPFEPVVPAQSQSSSSYYQRPPAQERRREAPPVAASKREPVRPARAAITATPLELWRSINPPLRAVLTGAAAVTALFIVGIALGVFHSSRPPLASTTTHPSNGVTLQTGGVTLPAGPAKAQAAQPVAAMPQAKPQPGQPTQTTQTQSAGTVTKPSPRVRQTHLVAEQSEKQIGDDVVIRHYSRPIPTQKPKQAGQQAGLKHFSDLEN
ncbi:MAG TPA: hypothetical protein VKV30_00125 [Candidatus Angelobacter sp.]|nr:hypothetical protein [Candidatus Angelobacter sp.]